MAAETIADVGAVASATSTRRAVQPRVAEAVTQRGRTAFVRGLRSHHPVVLLVAVALLYPVLLGVQAFVVSGRYTVLPESLLLRNRHDDFMHVSYEVALLKRHPPTTPAVYLVGGSSMRECITSGLALGRALSARAGRRVAAYDLGSQNQTLGESMAIVENLPPAPAGSSARSVVVVGIAGNRFIVPSTQDELETQGRELLLAAPKLAEFAKSDQARDFPARLLPGILPGIANYLMSYWRGHSTRLLEGHLPYTTYVHHKYTQSHVWSLSHKRDKVAFWVKKNGRAFWSNVRYNARLLDLVVRTARQRGFRVVLLELPENTTAVGAAYDPYKAVYTPLAERIAARNGAIYLRPQQSDAVKLVNTDFYDITHLVEPGRAKWQHYLAEQLAPLLEAGR
jgi:hypothetical protein